MPYLTADNIPDDTICYVVRIPADSFAVAAFMGAVSELTKAYNWEEFGEMTPDEMAASWLIVYEQMAESRGQCMIGSILPFARDVLPANVLLCDGTQYARVDYPVLYSVLSNNFIVDSDNLVVPNLSDKFVRGTSPDNPGYTGGSDTAALSVSNLPAHDHLYAHHTPVPVTIGAGAPVIVYSPPDIPTLTSATGAGTSFSIEPKYMALTYGIIAR